MIVLATILGLFVASGPDDFTLVMPVRPETAEGQRRLAERAMQICGNRYPMRQRYRFTGQEQLQPGQTGQARFEVRQELTCSNTPPPVATGEAAPADWQASEQDVRDVTALTSRYFTLVDQGNADGAHALWSEDQQEATPLDARRLEIERFRTDAGAPQGDGTTRLTWYVNPSGAPRPGIYVAVDYERPHANLVLNCGYLIWYREGDGRYSLTRQENTVMGRNAGAPTAEQLVQLRQASHCPS